MQCRPFRHRRRLPTLWFNAQYIGLTAQRPLSSTQNALMTIPPLVLQVVLHEADIIVLGQVAVLLQIRPFVCGHALHQVVDYFVRDQRVAQVKLGDVGLTTVLAELSHNMRGMGLRHTFPSATSLKLSKTCSAVF